MESQQSEKKKSLPTLTPAPTSPISKPTEQPNSKPQPSSDPLIPIKRKVHVVKKKEKEVIVVDKTTKADEFFKAYVKYNGNGTKAAMEVFNTKNKTNASAIAYQYLKRGIAARRVLFEKKGVTEGYLIDDMIAKAKASKTPEWSDRIWKLIGYDEFLPTKGQQVGKQTINIMSAQKNLFDDYVEGEFIGEDEDLGEHA